MIVSQNVLMITAMANAERWAEALANQLGLKAEVVSTRKAALAALRHREYSVVIADNGMIEGDPDGADLVWKHSGLAVPLEINFAISSGSRLVREVRAALARRAQEHTLALRTASLALESELRSTLTGLLLQSQLALTEPALTPELTDKLKTMAELAGTLGQKLKRPQA
jgi:signal transduction histidine kinase